jgi:uncharacterized OB-fold protein
VTATRAYGPGSPIVDSRLDREARANGWQCQRSRCGYFNLPHRRLCKKCGKRGRPTPTQEKASQSR